MFWEGKPLNFPKLILTFERKGGGSMEGDWRVLRECLRC